MDCLEPPMYPPTKAHVRPPPDTEKTPPVASVSVLLQNTMARRTPLDVSVEYPEMDPVPRSSAEAAVEPIVCANGGARNGALA